MKINKKLEKAFLNGGNIALTGQAGTGKTTNINLLIEKYKDKKNFALCSTTGIAATLINGQTIHSFLNLGMIRTNDLQKEVSRIINNRYAKWGQVQLCDVMVIDEASMCDGFMFSIIDEVLRYAKQTNKPFGGVQIILSFDLFQLPPVESNEKGFFFDSKSYNDFELIELKKVYRQNDKEFIDCLNRIRLAKHTNSDLEYLKKREFPELNYALLDTTCLYPTNKEADILNEYRLSELKGKEYIFKSDDTNYTQPTLLGAQRDFSKNLRAPEELKLKEGARVILLSNIAVHRGLCNGSIGHFVRKKGDLLVIKFGERLEYIDRKDFEVYERGELVFKRTQYPLVLGYACSIHKSQGMSLDSVAIDFARVFAPHMSYVALSRARNYEGLYLKNLSKNKIFVDNKVVDFINKTC